MTVLNFHRCKNRCISQTSTEIHADMVVSSVPLSYFKYFLFNSGLSVAALLHILDYF